MKKLWTGCLKNSVWENENRVAAKKFFARLFSKRRDLALKNGEAEKINQGKGARLSKAVGPTPGPSSYSASERKNPYHNDFFAKVIRVSFLVPAMGPVLRPTAFGRRGLAPKFFLQSFALLFKVAAF